MQSFLMTGILASCQMCGGFFVFVLFLTKGYEGQLTGHWFKKKKILLFWHWNLFLHCPFAFCSSFCKIRWKQQTLDCCQCCRCIGSFLLVVAASTCTCSDWRHLCWIHGEAAHGRSHILKVVKQAGAGHSSGNPTWLFSFAVPERNLKRHLQQTWALFF